MASAYVSLRVHLVFATKGRQPLIADAWRDRLHAYLDGTLRGLGAALLAVGGVADHVHVLVGIKTTHAVADLVRETKKAATEWVRSEIGVRGLAWQEGYAALSVGEIRPVVAYIQDQEAHHRKRSSADELRALLTEAGVEIGSRYFGWSATPPGSGLASFPFRGLRSRGYPLGTPPGSIASRSQV